MGMGILRGSILATGENCSEIVSGGFTQPCRRRVARVSGRGPCGDCGERRIARQGVVAVARAIRFERVRTRGGKPLVPHVFGKYGAWVRLIWRNLAQVVVDKVKGRRKSHVDEGWRAAVKESAK